VLNLKNFAGSVKMREIKFRAWDKDNNLMLYDIQAKQGYLFRDFLNNPRFVVMQYTGLKDKAGTEIYEGDKLVNPVDNRIFEVRWVKVRFLLFHPPYTRMDKFAASSCWGEPKIDEIGTDISKFGYCSKLEVIGTIHDRAEGE